MGVIGENMKNNIVEYLDEVIKNNPRKNIFIEKNRKITYKEFGNQSKKIASNILDKYDLKNKPIAIFIDKSINCLLSMFGTLYSRNFYCVIDVNSPKNRIDTIINTLEPSLIITDNKNIDKIKNYSYSINILNIDELDDIKFSSFKINYCLTDPAYVLFTSGSTGVPKGSVILESSLISYIDWFKEEFNINKETVFGSQTPFYFSMSVSDIFATVVSGATFVIIPKVNFSFPLKLIEFLNEYKINTIYWVPSALAIVANLKTFDYIKPKYLEKVLFAGEVMPMPVLNIWRKHLPKCLYANLFGPTETTDIFAFYKVNRKFKDNETLPMGVPCKNVDIIMIDSDNKESNEGEIYVRSPFVGNGYYNNKEKTDISFIQNPTHNNYIDIVYKTGDLGKYNKYGEIEYLGRKDFQIKHMGYRIELGEIESNINSLDGINICACIYQDDKIILYYESNNLDDDDVVDFSNKHLLNYMRPNVIKKIIKMPYNANGKIDRVKLKEMYKEGE